MRFATPLVSGTLLRRYKRFLADVRLDDGREVTAHLANPGSMMGLKAPGLRVWLEPATDPKRKLAFTWRLVELRREGPESAQLGALSSLLVGIDTGAPNRLVAEALEGRRIGALADYAEIRREVAYGASSRIDFLLSGADRPDLYLEVKNVHLVRRPGLAEFPDSVTKRGAKHLAELAGMVAAGHRAAMLYCIQRPDCAALSFAADLDPGYKRAYLDARAAGVEAMAFACQVSRDRIVLDRPVPITD